jgi:hypothetical protein
LSQAGCGLRQNLEEEWSMKAKSIRLLMASLFVLALAFTIGTQAAPKITATPASITRTESAQPPADRREAHPEIREAIASLRRAKEHMEHAAHDFGGHRVEAIRATDVAIRQLEDCLRYDKD